MLRIDQTLIEQNTLQPNEAAAAAQTPNRADFLPCDGGGMQLYSGSPTPWYSEYQLMEHIMPPLAGHTLVFCI